MWNHNQETSFVQNWLKFCTSGWPDRSRDLKEYWRHCGGLTLPNGLLLFQSRTVIPLDLRNETLQKIYHGHQGIQRCRFRVASSVWWPRVVSAIEQFVQSCPICQKFIVCHREPMMPIPLPNYSRERVAADLFELRNCSYLLVANCYLRFLEVQNSQLTHLQTL